MRFFLSAFLLFLIPARAVPQNDIGTHRLSLRGDFQAASPTQSQLFRSDMNGVIGGDLSLQVPISKTFYMGIGGNVSMFEGKSGPANIVEEEVRMFAYGPFLKAGVLPYLGKIFYVEASLKGGYRWLEINSPLCERKGRKSIHKQKGFSLEPRIGLWWDTGDGLDFGAVVGRQWILERYNEDMICKDRDPRHPDNSNVYGIWHFGFAFAADLVRPR
jgi:hypothetical protein